MLLTDSIVKLKGVGERTAKLYEKLGIHSVGELINHFPRGYERYDEPVMISSLRAGEVCAVEGMLTASAKPIPGNVRRMIVARVRDLSGELELCWFNSPYIMKQLPVGRKLVFRGKVSANGRFLKLIQPEIYTEEAYRQRRRSLRPIYALTAGITGNAVSKAVSVALNEVDIPERMPLKLRKARSFMKLSDAYREIHCPKDEEITKEAIRRLSYEEFYRFLLSMRQLRSSVLREANGFLIRKHTIADRILGALPYELTDAQKRVTAEIVNDLSGAYPMQRLLQGDVGSGKTIVSLLALSMCAEEGFQGCLMAPTEVLARQHFTYFQEMLAPFGIRVSLLVGSMTQAERKQSLAELRNGESAIAIGTHALFQESVSFKCLGLVIVDEQHRFGVKQREQLIGKGATPHLLIMSATPIPRTLAMMLYGDMDISLLDELPANRLPIKTCVVEENYRPTADRFLRDRLAAGEQVYVICPMIEDSESVEGENVADCAERLRTVLDPSVRIEILHGQMSGAEKNRIMEDFAKGVIRVLVSTTVIEVGINVPNATVIVIENAERFGLSALHQLRGRVGRGSKQSYCILFQGNSDEATKQRLSVLLKARSGFAIAEEDLRLRGPGDFFGIRQSGSLSFQLADVVRDADSLKAAREDVALLSDAEAEAEYNLLVAKSSETVVY